MIFNAKHTQSTMGSAILKYHHPSVYPFVKVYTLITIRRIFKIKKSTLGFGVRSLKAFVLKTNPSFVSPQKQKKEEMK